MPRNRKKGSAGQGEDLSPASEQRLLHILSGLATRCVEHGAVASAGRREYLGAQPKRRSGVLWRIVAAVAPASSNVCRNVKRLPRRPQST
jgi:hypothetical protein